MKRNAVTKPIYKRRAASPSLRGWDRRGITIVELIVVLTISLLLIGVSVGAIVAWRSWSIKKQNDASAEEIFYAVQAALLNQSSTGELTEFEREYMAALEENRDASSPLLFETDASTLLSQSGAQNAGDVYVEGSSQVRRLYSLMNGAAYDGMESAAGGDLLARLVEKYVVTPELLTGNVCVEFSMESATVYAVWYLGEACDISEFRAMMTAEHRVSRGVFEHIGYFGPSSGDKPEQVGVANKVAIASMSLVNAEELYVSFSLGEKYAAMTPALDYTVNVYTLDEGETAWEYGADLSKGLAGSSNATLYMSIRISAGSIGAYREDTAGDISRASSHENEINATVIFATGDTRTLPLRAYYKADENNEVKRTVYLVLDAIDQAVATDLRNDPNDQSNKDTYSATRFFPEGRLITADLTASGIYTRNPHTLECAPNNVEHTMFRGFSAEGSAATAVIANVRHFWNLRFLESRVGRPGLGYSQYETITYSHLSGMILDWQAAVDNSHVYFGGDVVKATLSSFRAFETLHAGSVYKSSMTGRAVLRNFLIQSIDGEAKNNVGLFSTIENGATVQDVTLTATLAETDFNCVGLLCGINNGTVKDCAASTLTTNLALSKIIRGNNEVGVLCGTNNGTILNSTSSGTAYGNSCVGGIAGLDRAKRAIADARRMEKNINYAAVSGNAAVGGIVGAVMSVSENDGKAEVWIFACENYGAITCLMRDSLFCGGIVGLNEEARLHDCISVPQMEIPQSVDEYRGYFVGGVVGFNANDGMVDDCSTDTTDVHGRPIGGLVCGYRYVGGICGYNTTALTEGQREQNGELTNNANYVDVMGDKYVGGIVGANALPALDGVEEHFNKICAGTLQEGDTLVLGAPLETFSSEIKVQHWTNYGIVTAHTGYAGGITGFNAGLLLDAYSNIFVTSDVGESYGKYGDHASGDFVGGIAGYNCGYIGRVNSADPDIEVVASVIGGNFIGGVVGYNDLVEGDTNENDLYASGIIHGYRLTGGYIKGKNFVGGYFGVNSVTEMYLRGALHASPNAVQGSFFVGGIIGGSLTPHREGDSVTIQCLTDNPLGRVEGDYFVGGFVGYLATVDMDNYNSTYNGVSGLPVDVILLEKYARNLIRGAENELAGLTGDELEAQKHANACAIFTARQAEGDVVENGNQPLVTLTTPSGYKNTIGEVRGKMLVAGILGFATMDTRLAIRNVINNTAVAASDTVRHGEIAWDAIVEEANQDEVVSFMQHEAGSLYALSGGIIGFVSDLVVLDNCQNTDIAIIDTLGTYTASIAEVSLGTIRNCSSGIVVARDNIGGIVGINVGGAVVEGCRLTGTIYGNNNIGGIVAHNYGTVRRCTVSGENSGYVAIQSSGTDIGGIVGSNFDGRVINCTLNGSIEGNGVFVGGLVGRYLGGTIGTFMLGDNIEIVGKRCVGGLIGLSMQDLSGAKTKGAAYGSRVVAHEGEAGGIIGASGKDHLQITNCVNTFDVVANSGTAGGILPVNGWYYDENDVLHVDGSGFVISGCYGGGDVSVEYQTGEGSFAGGIAAINLSGNTIENCTVGFTVVTEDEDDGEAEDTLTSETKTVYTVSATTNLVTVTEKSVLIHYSNGTETGRTETVLWSQSYAGSVTFTAANNTYRVVGDKGVYYIHYTQNASAEIEEVELFTLEGEKIVEEAGVKLLLSSNGIAVNGSTGDGYRTVVITGDYQQFYLLASGNQYLTTDLVIFVSGDNTMIAKKGQVAVQYDANTQKTELCNKTKVTSVNSTTGMAILRESNERIHILHGKGVLTLYMPTNSAQRRFNDDGTGFRSQISYIYNMTLTASGTSSATISRVRTLTVDAANGSISYTYWTSNNNYSSGSFEVSVSTKVSALTVSFPEAETPGTPTPDPTPTPDLDGSIQIMGIGYVGGITAKNYGVIHGGAVDASATISAKEPDRRNVAYLGGAVGINYAGARLEDVSISALDDDPVRIIYTYAGNSMLYMGGVVGSNEGVILGDVTERTPVRCSLSVDNKATTSGAIGGVVALNLSVGGDGAQYGVAYYDVVGAIVGESGMTGDNFGVGGVVGVNGYDDADNRNDLRGSVAYCSFSGTITCPAIATAFYRVGGIVGTNNACGEYNEENSLVEYCSVGLFADTTIDAYLGLIGGYAGYCGGTLQHCPERSGTKAVTIQESTSDNGVTVSMAGGVAYLATYGYVTDLTVGSANASWRVNSYFSSKGSEDYGIGGVIGVSYSYHNLEYLTNYAAVTCTRNACYGTGGIVGLIKTAVDANVVNHCANHGAIQGSYAASAIVGYFSRCCGYVMNCSNTASVSQVSGRDANFMGIFIGTKWTDEQSNGMYITSCTNTGTAMKANGKLDMGYYNNNVAPIAYGLPSNTAASGTTSGNCYTAQLGTSGSGNGLTIVQDNGLYEIRWPSSSPTYYQLEVYKGELTSFTSATPDRTFILAGSMNSAKIRLNPTWTPDVSFTVRLVPSSGSAMSTVVSAKTALPTPEVRLFTSNGNTYAVLNNPEAYAGMDGNVTVKMSIGGTDVYTWTPGEAAVKRVTGMSFSYGTEYGFAAQAVVNSNASAAFKDTYSNSFTEKYSRTVKNGDEKPVINSVEVIGTAYDSLQVRVVVYANGSQDKTTVSRVELVGVTADGAQEIINAETVMLQAYQGISTVNIPVKVGDSTIEKLMEYKHFFVRAYSWRSDYYQYFHEVNPVTGSNETAMTWDYNESGERSKDYVYVSEKVNASTFTIGFLPIPQNLTVDAASANGQNYILRWSITEPSLAARITVYGSEDRQNWVTLSSVTTADAGVTLSGNQYTYTLNSTNYNYAYVYFEVVMPNDGSNANEKRVESFAKSDVRQLSRILETPARPAASLKSKDAMIYRVTFSALSDTSGLRGYRLLVTYGSHSFYFPSADGVYHELYAEIDLSALSDVMQGSNDRQAKLYLIAVAEDGAELEDSRSNPYNFTLPKQLGPSVINGSSAGHNRVDLSLEWTGRGNVTEQEFVSGGFFTVVLQGSDTNSGSYVIEYYYSPDGTTVPDFENLSPAVVQSAAVTAANGFLNGGGIAFSPIGAGGANLGLNYAGQYVWMRVKTQSNNMVSSVWSAPVCIGQLPKIKLNAPSMVEGTHETDREEVQISPYVWDTATGSWKTTKDGATTISRVAMHKSLTFGMVVGANTYAFEIGTHTLTVTVEGTTVTYTIDGETHTVTADSAAEAAELFTVEIEAVYERSTASDRYRTVYRIRSGAELIIGYHYDENGVATGVDSLTIVLPDIESFPYFVVDAATHSQVTVDLTTEIAVTVSGDSTGAEANTIVWALTEDET